MDNKNWAAQKRAYAAGAKIQFRYWSVIGWSGWLDVDMPEWENNGHIQYRVKPIAHKHHDLIIAWANGAEIEMRYKLDRGGWSGWYVVDQPSWHPGITVEFRLKAEPKPDIVIERYIYTWQANQNNRLEWTVGGQMDKPANTRFTFDGETLELKSMEVI